MDLRSTNRQRFFSHGISQSPIAMMDITVHADKKEGIMVYMYSSTQKQL